MSVTSLPTASATPAKSLPTCSDAFSRAFVKSHAVNVQLVVRQVEVADLATALKGVSDDVRDKVTRNLSERGRENLLEEIDLLGPVRVKMVEEAQTKIVAVIRSLEDSGQIEIQRGGDADDLIV